jgi:serine/threonine-protein kinase RsbT
VQQSPTSCIRILHDSDVVVARRRVRELGTHVGLSEGAIAALATAVTEIARNIVVHAGSGKLSLDVMADSSRSGVVVTAQDNGPGIADIAQAMHDGHSTGAGLGLGLSSAQRLVDEFEIDSAVGAGTKITLRQWSRHPVSKGSCRSS